MRSATSHWKNATVAACACALLLGCASIGPSTITRDRFDYVTAISESLKRQVLLNLLKVRYADAPVITGILYLIQSGYPADFVLRICVNTINGRKRVRRLRRRASGKRQIPGADVGAAPGANRRRHRVSH